MSVLNHFAIHHIHVHKSNTRADVDMTTGRISTLLIRFAIPLLVGMVGRPAHTAHLYTVP